MAAHTGYQKFLQNALKYGFSLFGLPKTGQTIEYQPGDDGTHQKGYPKDPPRFVDNGDGTITDKATGLMWVKDGFGAGCNNGERANWEDAITFCAGLSFAGHDDWRLPNVHELATLLDHGRYAPSIDPIFINTYWDNFWTSTTWTWESIKAWYCSFWACGVYNIEKEFEMYVRPVRGGNTQ